MNDPCHDRCMLHERTRSVPARRGLDWRLLHRRFIGASGSRPIAGQIGGFLAAKGTVATRKCITEERFGLVEWYP